MIEDLLGFQLRVIIVQMKQWDSVRRSTHLLREDIAFPLSVDEDVWPPCDNVPLLESIFSDYSPDPYSAPNGLGVYCSVNPAVLNQSSAYNGAFLIGVTVVNDTTDRASELRAKHFVHDATFSIEQLRMTGWECLGYDVANEWLLSCLMNCGYKTSEKESLIQKFAGTLNEFGLFTSIKDAQRFCIVCDTRVPEHAPFATYGIWSKGKP